MTGFKVGDHVIITKPIVDFKDKKGKIVEVVYKDNVYNIPNKLVSCEVSEKNLYYYRVSYTKLGGLNNADTCNIFADSSDERIEIDIEYYRDLKLKELGL